MPGSVPASDFIGPRRPAGRPKGSKDKPSSPRSQKARRKAKKAAERSITHPRGHNLRGRQPGVKNKTTIFKELTRDGFEKALKHNNKFKQVFNVLIEKALEGDMQAMKMLMDRIVPVSKAIDLTDLEKTKGMNIQINIGNLEDAVEVKSDPEEDLVVSEQ